MGSQRLSRVEQAGYTRPTQIHIWPCSGEGSPQEGWHLPVGYTGRGSNREKMAAVPLRLALKPHNSYFPPVSLAPPELLSLRQSPVFVLGYKESVRRPFERMPGFSVVFHLTWTDRVPTVSHSQMLWELFFPVLVLRARELSVGLGPLTSQQGPLWPRYSS